jgi:stabilin-1
VVSFPRAGDTTDTSLSLLSPVQNNGGCSPYAVCKSSGDGQRTCTCDTAHTVGDGFTCRARVGLVMMLRSDPLVDFSYAPWA